MFLLDRLITLTFLDHYLHIGFPSRQGLAHLREGSIVHFIPFEACVIKLSGELVSFVQLREEEVAVIRVVRMPQVLAVDRDGAPENAPELKRVPLDYSFGRRWIPVGVHFSNFLLEGAEHGRAPVLPLPLRLAAICACAAIISGGILGGTISGVIPDGTISGVILGGTISGVRICVFRGVLIEVRLFLHLLGQLPECLGSRTAGLIIVCHVSL